jgi:hypothetical protein
VALATGWGTVVDRPRIVTVVDVVDDCDRVVGSTAGSVVGEWLVGLIAGAAGALVDEVGSWESMVIGTA